MNTRFKASGSVVLSEELEEYTTQRLEKVVRLLDKTDPAILCEVEFGTDGGSRTGKQFRAEINLSVPHALLRAEASAETMHEAIDTATHELRDEVRKHQNKGRDLFRRSAARLKEVYRSIRG